MENNQVYIIEKNIPIPERNKHWSRFPFDKMEVGDSFLVDLKKEKKTSCNQLRQLLYREAIKYCVEMFSDAKFSFHCDRIAKKVRVFRTK